ncbi:phosphoacetylglucosamine mutase [Harmonia axyridis]|uniref:phosphoacetylglucosamine mutase n=1 Tax=Harmonia axyridis TaxID=115357 RepID=UPI001E27889F|nr:phosphoacetylglucosamine mutase [Harmonia axyridis]XP_045470716.1 phosphoacetylglucosamine mutase [Harmonia axyridis]
MANNHNNYKTVYAFAREMHPKTEKFDVQYGTAGFRAKANTLGYVMYRMGLLAVLRARYKKACIGAMITASHNPEPDNGVKLIDPCGEMLEQSWEAWATKFANVADDRLEEVITEIVTELGIEMTQRVEILVGKDTRPSSPSLAKALCDGVLALSGKPIDYGIVTTPQLHYFVYCRNSRNQYGFPTEEYYYRKLCDAFKKIRGKNFNTNNYQSKLYYDGANGVGAKKIKYFQECLGDSLMIDRFNDELIGTGKLNYMCGADYVKTKQAFPNGVPKEVGQRCCSVDGDADRLMYYYLDENEKCHLLDGDRIAILIAEYLKGLVEDTGFDVNLGLVQTAYANGASTEYITNTLNIPVSFVCTGVKYLHHEAQKYDIGVYFEANGHGTVIFKKEFKEKLQTSYDDPTVSVEVKRAIKKLQTVIDLINETVGDALSDMLLVETILHSKGWSIQDWEKTYTDLPNRLMKVSVKDRNTITTTNAERTCLKPEGLQKEIDMIVKKYKSGRSFVRPSGTEDLVRVYAEAASKDEADQLALEVALKVHEMAEGIGPEPKL